MPEWIPCSACGLKHSARSDGLCPRCRQPVAGRAAGAPQGVAAGPATPTPTSTSTPTATATPTPTPAASSLATHALRVVGAALLVLGASRLMGFGKEGGVDAKVVAEAILDLLLGGALLAGLRQRGLLVVAMVRAAVGAALGAGTLALSGDRLSGGLQLLLAAGLLLVLLGRARAHVVAGAIVAVAAAGVDAVGVAKLLSEPPLEDTVSSRYGPVLRRLSSSEMPSWSLDLPGDHWRAAGPSPELRPPDDADAMILWPAKDAVVVVVATSAEERHGAGPSLSYETGRLLQETARSFDSLQEISQTVLGTQLEASLVRAKGTREGHQTELMFLVAVFDQGSVKLVGRCPPKHVAEVYEEFVKIARSLSRDPRGSGT